MKKVAFHNLGCKVNSYELDVMRQILSADGYEEVSFQDRADIYVVNTCTVTNIADRKSRQMLHRAKKQNPDAIVRRGSTPARAANPTTIAKGTTTVRNHSPAPKPARRHPNHTFNAAQIAIAEAAAIAALTTPPPQNAAAAAIGNMTA